MALNENWKRRIEKWQKAIMASIYAPLGPLDLSGFATTEQLTPTQALAREFQPMPPGTRWGAKWEYGWFKASLTLPEAAAGRRIIFALENPAGEIDWSRGDECLVWIDGREVGAIDFGHKEITLTRSGVPGQRFEILFECYAGHGRRNEGGGPNPYGNETVPEPGPTQLVINQSSYGIWREEVYQLLLDWITLFNARDALDQNSLRVAEIDRGLMDATNIVDLELPEPEMLATVQAGRARLKPLLERSNGPTTPLFHAFGHGHLDIEWLWPLAETERKMARTVGTQLTLMEEYPEYRFLQSQPHLMNMLKQRYPDLYERFKAAVKSGNIIIEGGMWVEADTNITGGESLVRQLIHGKRFMRAEYGVESQILWLPDVFGYSGALPQIMAGCGVTGFMTAKIFWLYNGGEPFPYNNFIWEGIDGSGVLANLYNGYGHFPLPDDVLGAWTTRNQRNDISSMTYAIGWGDGGGGASRPHLEFARRVADFEGLPRVQMSGPVEFFTDLRARGPITNRYVGELYFQNHRGTYTSQAKAKQGNRKSELALREAELWATAAAATRGFAYGPDTLDAAWKTVLLHQFHDGLPGSSIRRVYAEMERDHAAVIAQAGALARQAAAGLAAPTGSGATGFNSLSWARTALVPLPEGVSTAAPTQVVAGQTLAEVRLPACGWAPLAPLAAPAASGVTATPRSLENEHLKAQFNDLGEITSLVDKASGRELCAAPVNALKLYKDVPSWFDAWDIDPQYVDAPVALPETASLTLQAAGPLVGELKLVRPLSPHSQLTQIIRLRRGSRRIDFETSVEWHESHKLLKVAFPVNIHANEALHEIQFGHITRPNHTNRQFDADRFEVSNHKWSALMESNRGVAVLNDCKYGLNVLANSINLTLLKSPLAPDMQADQGTQTFTYALYAWNGGFSESGVVKEAYDLNVPALVLPGAPAGSQPISLFNLDVDNVVIETVKPAEDNSGRVVVRLYESLRQATTCILATALPVKRAALTNLLEEQPVELACPGGQLKLEFRPFEIKTVMLEV